jgi:hypothetical protein
MEKFNIGDKVMFQNELYIYTGIFTSETKTQYHCVAKPNTLGNSFATDDELTLLETASYFPVPKYKVGQVLYFIDNVAHQVIILDLPNVNNPFYYVYRYNHEDLMYVKEEELKEDYK